MTTKIEQIKDELYFYILAVEDIILSGQREFNNTLIDNAKTSLLKLRLADSWLSEAKDQVEVKEYKHEDLTIKDLLITWYDYTTLEKLNYLTEWLVRLKQKVSDLNKQSERLNEETKSNYNQAVESYKQDPNPVDESILKELSRTMDGQLIDIREEVNLATRNIIEARFFLEYIIEKY